MKDSRLDPYRQTLNQGTQIFRVRRKNSPDQPNFFFADPIRAVVWALFIDSGVSPISNENVSEEVLVKTFIGSLVKSFRFPLITEYVVAEYTTTQPIPYYTASNLTDEFFGKIAKLDLSTAMFYETQATSVLLGEELQSFVADHPPRENGAADYEAYSQAVSIIRELESASQGGDEVTGRGLITAPIFRIVQYDERFRHTFDHNVVWDVVWGYFFNNLAAKGGVQVSAVSEYFQRIFADRQLVNTIFSGGSTPGYSGCLDSIVGFRNNNGSCFMDSTLLCMFAFKNSPYFRNMIQRPLNPADIQKRVCSLDIGQDLALRREIQNQLIIDIQQITSGQRFVCSRLRDLLGRLCRLNINDRTTDLSQGPHDPSQLYSRLCNAVNYYPMHIIEFGIRAASEVGDDEQEPSTEFKNDVYLDLRAEEEDVQAISWPWSWNRGYNNVHSGDRYTWRKLDLVITDADCIVVHLDRSVGAYMQQEQPPRAESIVQPPSFVSGMVLPNSAVAPMTNLFSTMNLGPTNPAQRNEFQMTYKRILVDRQFDVNDQPYLLRAVTYLPWPGHYAALLKCGTNWFNYDDLQTERVIAKAMVSDLEAQQIIETQGVLFFYYPPLGEN